MTKHAGLEYRVSLRHRNRRLRRIVAMTLALLFMSGAAIAAAALGLELHKLPNVNSLALVAYTLGTAVGFAGSMLAFWQYERR